MRVGTDASTAQPDEMHSGDAEAAEKIGKKGRTRRLIIDTTRPHDGESPEVRVDAGKYRCDCSAHDCAVAIDVAAALEAADLGWSVLDADAVRSLLMAFAVYDETVRLDAECVEWMARVLEMARGDVNLALLRIVQARTEEIDDPAGAPAP
jgi:hypothetical protein